MLKAFGIVVLVLSLFTLGIWSQSNRIRTWLNPDYVRIELRGKLLHQRVSIYWKTEGAVDSTLVYQEGKQLVKSFNKSGYNIFSITYEGKYIGTVDHFKTDQYNAHIYSYTIEEQEGIVNLTNVVIFGKDGHR